LVADFPEKSHLTFWAEHNVPLLQRFLVNAPPEIEADTSTQTLPGWAKKLNESDAAILASAISAKPDYFITGDSHFLANRDIKENSGLKVVTPAQFMKLLKPDQGDF
jgi:predicted nucleic acid-binding protein